MTQRLYGCTEERRALETWRILESATDEPFQSFHHVEVHNRQRARCYLCGEPFVRRERNHPLGITRDHVFPRAKGGQDGSNQLLAHRRCNELKSHRWPHPCEVLYLFAIYATPLDPYRRRVLANHARLRRAELRRAMIERLR